MSYLMEIADTVQQVADAIAAILKVEVEIIDTEHYRVGGTGSVKKLGPKQQWGYVNEHVIKTRQHFILTNPGSHQICQICELKDNCYCKAGIFCPIDYEGECIGIINLMGFDDEQQKSLLDNAEKYMEFLVRMASLISSKVAEQKAMDKLQYTSRQLEVIVNTLQHGIIAVDRAGRITCFNNEAGRILGFTPAEVTGQTVWELFPKFPFKEVLTTGKEILDTIQVHYVGNKRKTFICSTHPIICKGKIMGAVGTVRDYREAHRQAQRLTANDYTYTFDDIISASGAMKEIKEQAKRAAQGYSTILIEGESGTGKELFARAIHTESPFYKGPFVAINCSAIPDSLLESELFGYESGAFTGARAGGKPGKFELADGGTLFLDEIGELPLFLQAKLLRVLQDRVIEKLGGTSSRPINVRIIAATNRNLLKMVNNGEFRDDLYYRLSVIPITIPPLRERKEDIAILLEHNLHKYARIMNKEIKGFAPDVFELLTAYHWPGNVRELENTVEYAVSFTDGEWIRKENLPPRIRERLPAADGSRTSLQEKSLELERNTIEELLKKYGTSVEGKDKVAAELGISRATLYRKIKKLGIGTKR